MYLKSKQKSEVLYHAHVFDAPKVSQSPSSVRQQWGNDTQKANRKSHGYAQSEPELFLTIFNFL
ncbi:hypothetical protein L484_012266 [Morus notabilis]|uniref:Uncharacterized protein n=1 Tax=Morus notabilis TaxID=981085 RepID=W9QZW4_9ROSA|nr:hypothetical protein L484_012266 [Morus notabilis]